MESLSCCTRQTTLISQTKSSTHSTSPVVLQLRPRSLRQVRPSRRRQQEQRNPDLPPGISKIHARLNSRVSFFVQMKSSAGTPMVLSCCERSESVFSKSIPNNEMHDHDPARVLDRFVRRGLAGNAQQRTGWEFSGVAAPARVISLWVVRSDRGYWR